MDTPTGRPVPQHLRDLSYSKGKHIADDFVHVIAYAMGYRDAAKDEEITPPHSAFCSKTYTISHNKPPCSSNSTRRAMTLSALLNHGTGASVPRAPIPDMHRHPPLIGSEALNQEKYPLLTHRADTSMAPRAIPTGPY